MLAALVWTLVQAGTAADWTGVRPLAPTVGDTVWLEWRVAAPAGWRVRAVKLPASETLEPLADPAVARAAGRRGWLVRYAVVAWTPGAAQTAPALLLLGPDGEVDSLTADTARFTVRSVLGDSAATAEPRPAVPPLRPETRDAIPAVLALLLGLGLLFAGVAWRRRGPRRLATLLQVPVEPEIPDARWLAAGEPRAVAARATGLLRTALAQAIPSAHAALSTPECLAVVAKARPDAPLRDLEAVLHTLDQIAFATAHGTDVSALAERARALAAEFPA